MSKICNRVKDYIMGNPEFRQRRIFMYAKGGCIAASLTGNVRKLMRKTGKLGSPREKNIFFLSKII